MASLEERVAVLESQHTDVLRMHGEVLTAIQRIKVDVIGVLDQHAESSKVRCDMRHRDINNRIRSSETMINSRERNRLVRWQIIAGVIAALLSGVGASFATTVFHGGGSHVAAVK